jgi:hypothetical protein
MFSNIQERVCRDIRPAYLGEWHDIDRAYDEDYYMMYLRAQTLRVSVTLPRMPNMSRLCHHVHVAPDSTGFPPRLSEIVQHSTM